ncbi:DUF2147 domain-containing protein [Brevirhabdus sp.]|uniref:DUF2147 domain-containing protein n=1 Tax=Brevirhabdus sp. TaxID=2004514 RepID=UPI004057F297
MFKRIAAAAALGAMMAGPALAGGISGTWQTERNDEGNIALVQIGDCGGTYCGKLVKSFGPDGKEFKSRNTGKNLVWNMVDKGNGAFGNGKIWDPGSDKIYSSKMQLKGDALKVSGCVLIICKSQVWTRVK